MAAEDRFANVFTGQVVMSAANTLTFSQLSFGITLRDRVAIVIDEIYWYIQQAALIEMTTLGDEVKMGITLSDQVSVLGVHDSRVVLLSQLTRMDFGTAASGVHLKLPIKESYSPPVIVLPTRLFVAVMSSGLASAAVVDVRMHYRTVPITQDRQIIEILETLQLQ